MGNTKEIKDRPVSRYQGATLPLVMIVILLLLLVGTGTLTLGLQGRIFSTRTAEQLRATAAADAGLAKAVYEMNLKLQTIPWDGSTLPEAQAVLLANSDADFSYNITGDQYNGFVVNVTGQSGQMAKTIRCNLELQGPFDYAIFTKDQLELKSGTEVDWYNYDASDSSMKIGTNNTASGSIVLMNGSIVNGDVVVGPDGIPAIVVNNNGGIVMGNIYSNGIKYLPPEPIVPDWLLSVPSGGKIKNDATICSSGKYEEINLKNSETVEIIGNIILFVTGDITLGNTAEIIVSDDGDSSLILYMAGDYEGKNSSSVNNQTLDPSKLKIFGLDTCSSLRFKNNTELYAAIYAPNADVIFDNSAQAYGSVTARTFEQKNSSKFNYDASLRDVEIDEDCIQFVINHWREQ